MKIAALLPHLELWGGVRRYLELGNELVSRGHNYVIYTPEGQPPRWFDFSGEVRPFSYLSESRHDIALCSEYSLLQEFLAISARAKFFYFVLAGHRLERTVARLPFRFLGNSEGICRRIERRYGVRCERAPGGINPRIFHPLNHSPHEGEFRILCYGRIYRKRKGIHLILRAVEALWRRYPQVKLLLFDCPVRGEKRDSRQLLRTPVPHEFFWDLPQSSMAWMYSQADIFVSAERRAGWSNPTAEAMACGVPVICTPSGTKDFAIPGETALVVPWPFPFLLRWKMERLMRDEALRQHLSQAGLKKIQEFTWSRLAARLEELFASSLALWPHEKIYMK